jgi:uncharacterized protein
MPGELDLHVLLKSMQPMLYTDAYGFAVVPRAQVVGAVFALIEEDEGVTVIAPLSELVAMGIGISDDASWARISLAVQSDLAAVGLTASFSAALAARGISANVVAGFHHDHIFVPWQRRCDAMAALSELSNA